MQYAIGACLDVSCSSAVTMAGSIDVDLIADVGSLKLLISSRHIPRTTGKKSRPTKGLYENFSRHHRTSGLRTDLWLHDHDNTAPGR